MATEPDEVRTDVEEEEGGGPVKSFLEHLEDFRWTLIKIAVSVSVAMLLCLIAGDRVVTILKRPLEKAQVRYSKTDYIAVALFGTNRLATFHLDENQQKVLGLTTNHFVAIHADLQPSTDGTNVEIKLWLDTSPVAERLAKKINVELNTLSPAGGFFVAFQVAMYGGLALASPFIFYFIAQFVFPALKIKERKYINRGLGIAIPLFLVGITFCYFLLMPMALAASQIYSNWLGFSANMWRAEDYISFVCKFMLGMGLGFEMPVVILVLVKIGILDYQMLAKGRRYMIVVNLVLGALLTTPEVLTQIIMFVPLQALYEVSIWIAWYWDQPDRAKARRRLALVLTILLGGLLWLGYHYGWPWLRQYWR